MDNETGRLVAAIRGLKGLTQAELAELSRVPKPYISYQETGKMPMSDKYLAQLEEALGVDFENVRPAFRAFAIQVVHNCHPDA